MNYYLTVSADNTAFIGSGYTPDGTFPTGSIQCDQTTAENYQQYVPDGKGGYTSAATSVLLQQAQIAQSIVLKQACSTAIIEGVPFVDSFNNSYTLSMSTTDQINGQAAATSSQFSIMSAITWSASANIPTNTVMVSAGEYYIALPGGVTGDNPPDSLPTEFSVPVKDGTVTWELFGFIISTTTGNVWMRPVDLINAYKATVNYIIDQRSKLQLLLTTVNNATTTSEVTAVTW